MPIIGVIDSSKSGNLTPGVGFHSIASYTSTGGVGTVTFSGIPSYFTDLELWINAKDDAALGSTSLSLRFNNDNTAKYNSGGVLGYGASTQVGYMYDTAQGTPTSSMYFYQSYQGGNSGSTYFSPMRIEIPSYANTSQFKNAGIQHGSPNNYPSTGNYYVGTALGTWQSTTAVNRVDIYAGVSGFKNGSTFHLFGIKAA